MADACHNPSFLKKITELPMRTLPLPSSFVKRHGKLLKSGVILEGPSRKQWKVVVEGSSSLNVTFGKGWEEFVIAHVLQLGDQLCFTLTANSHFQVEVYDESGCQKTSALDATGSNAPVPSFPRRLSEFEFPPSVSESHSAAARVPQTQTLDDPTLKVENFSMSTKEAGDNPLSDFQLGSSPLLLRRESALESIRRDSARKGSAVRDPYVFLPTEGGSATLPNSNPRGLVPDSLLDLADCFVDMQKILSERPDLMDTEPLVIEDFPPCWELHEHTTTPTAASSTSFDTTRRISTLFSSRPPDLQIASVSKVENHETAATPTQTGSVPSQKSEQRTPQRVSLRPAALQIPPVLLESESQTPTSTKTTMRLSQIQNLDNLTMKAENLALYTKLAAEEALSELQLESATASPLTGSPLSRRESSVLKAQSFSI